MWKKKRIASVVLGVSVTLTSVMPAVPAYAVNGKQTQETERTSFKRAKNLSTPSDAEEEFEDEEFEDEELPEEDFEAPDWEEEEPEEDFEAPDWEEEEIPDTEGTLATPSDAEEMEEQNQEKPKPGKVPTATMSNAEQQQTHLAVFTGEIPEAEGVEWDETVTADDFEKPYSTVTIKSVEGETYKVEVVPKDIVYFIDSGAGESTPAYEAVAQITGNLGNDAADAEWTEERGWGYTGKDKDKGNSNTEDKDDTGFYGHNAANNPVSYILSLDAGTYKITSCHKDWWNKDRPMQIQISYGDTVLNAGTLNGSGINEYVFTLEQPEEVRYEINNTANQGSVISWLAVEEADEDEVDQVPLEDCGRVEARNGAALEADYGDGYMLNVKEGWISGGDSPKDGGGIITDAESLFQAEEFTWYTDFSFNGTHDNTSAFLLGNEENHIRLIPAKNDNSAVLRVTAGGTEQDYALKETMKKEAWHSVAVLYSEDDSQGYVELYADGKKVLDNVEIGFKFSDQDSITAGYGITYKTGFMRDGKYDNIVVLNRCADGQEAAEETKARLEEKNSHNQNLTGIVINGADVEKAAENMNGLTFKGFGVLDCNSTNALLLDYKAQHPEKYWEMLEILFGGERPIMQHIKIEMGNDKNTSTGSQACTMRYEDEYPDVTRVTGFQLAADAKKINPDVKVSLLYWCAPGWVGTDWNNIYKWLKNTTLAAYREYGYMIDIISPGVNEQKDDPNWIKQFNNWVETDTEGMLSSDDSVSGFRDGEAELFHQIQVLMSDEVGIASCGPQMTSDEELRNAVDIVGYHYNTDDDSAGSFKRLAEEFDKEIWNSEAQATFGSTADRPNNNMVDNADPGTGIGGNGSPLEMANTVIKGFVNSRRTHFVYQPTFGAFYEGTQYNYKDVMAARDPWSGYVNYDGALSVMQHFSKFAVTGWEYDTPDENVVWRAIPSASKSEATGTNPVNGRNGGDNYITLASPDKKDFSVVICNDSGKTKEFSIRPRDLDLAEGMQLKVWETRAAEDGQLYNENYVKHIGNLSAAEDGSYTLTVKPWSIVTVTTLDMEGMEEELSIPAATEDGRYVLDTDETGKTQNTEDTYLYVDDYNYADMGNVMTYEDGQIVESDQSFIESRGGKDGFYPLYTQDTNGTFEVVMDETGNGALEMTGQTGGGWWNGGEPSTTVGDYRWTNYKASVDFDLTSTSEHLLLGVRQRGAAGGGDNKVSMSAYNIGVNSSGEWIFRRYGTEIARGEAEITDPGACNVAIRAAEDTITAYVDGKEVYTYTDENPQLEGRVMLGVGMPGASWKRGRFDNLKVETIPGYTPYFTMVHDNLHMDAWDGENAGEQTLVYEGSWSHVNQKGSQYSQRSLSSTSQAGASVSYTFTGTGFALIGQNSSNGVVDVSVDGETLYQNVSLIQTSSHQPYLVIHGLKDGEHTITVTLASGKLDVDSIGYISASETVSSQIDTSSLLEVIKKGEELKQEDYDADSWNDYQEALTSKGRWTTELVNEILADPVSYGADQETINEITSYYETLQDKLLKKDAPIEIISPEKIPEILAVPVGSTLKDIVGKELPSTVAVKNQDGTTNDAAEISWKLSGNTNTAYSSITATGTVVGGKNLSVTVAVETVPDNLVYFIDSGTDDTGIYSAYQKVSPELKNEAPDKIFTDGSWGRNSTCAVKSNTNALDKTDTGLYNDTEPIVYKLPLEAGIYTLTAGFTEWWGYGRDMSQTITYTLSDGTEKTVNGDSVSFGERGKATGTVSFILPEDAVVTYTVAKTKSQSPVISWLAVASVDADTEASWSPVFHSNEDNQWDGLITKGTVVNREDPEQGEVIHMNAAGTTYIQLDPESVNITGYENMTMSFDLKSETADGNFFTVAIGQNDQKYLFLRTRENETYTTITKGSWGAEQGASAQVNTLNKWVHIDIVVTPEQLVTYMDGVPVSTVDKTILMADLGTDPIIYLGKSFYSGDKYFAGAFDNIEIYNRARSASELELAYEVGQARKLERQEYSEESWKVFEEALADAESVLNSSTAEDGQRKEALENLKEAKSQLVKEDKPVDPDPDKPVDPDPDKPVDPDPDKPVDPDPDKPVDPDPDKPVDPEPDKPVDPDPDKPVDPEPDKPVTPDKPDYSGGSDSVSSDDGSDSGSQKADEIRVDAKKGYVNTATGIITGNRKGYSSWISEKHTDLEKKEEIQVWKLQYADGTFASGKMKTREDGTVYEQVAWEQINGSWYAFDANGYALAGFIQDVEAGETFYVDINRGMLTGWQKINEQWYYFQEASDGKKGRMIHSSAMNEIAWEQIHGSWYAFGSDGHALSGFIRDVKAEETFYVDINKGMLTGKQEIDGKWYYFQEDSDGKQGRMLEKQLVKSGAAVWRKECGQC